MSRPAIAALAVAASVTVAASARAQSTEAAALFEQGRAALAQKDYATACTKLEASNRIERAVGTLISLAECEEGQKKLASARLHWKEAADLAQATHDRLDRGPYATKRGNELDKRVPRVTLTLAPGAPGDTQVARDGIDLGAAAFGAPLPIDPGPHKLLVTAKGRAAREVPIDLAEGEQKTLAVEPGAAEAPPPSTAEHPVTPAPAPAEKASGGGGQRTLGLIVGGIGIVGLGAGAVTGLMASSKWSSAKSDCGAGCAPSSPAQKEKDDAKSLATISTIAFVAGGALVAGGAILFFLAPSPSSTAVVVRPTVGGLELTGRFE